jgi:hypothetical protein
MMKALITKNEIRQFIFDAINEHGRNQVVNRAEIRNILNISEYELDQYLDKGLPWIGKPTRKKFNVNECRKWLDANTRKS